MNGYFITATGTGIGKTFTTCALIHAARKRNISVRGFKPIISGWDEHDRTSDVQKIIEAGAEQQIAEAVAPWRFKAPLSPHRAAALEGKKIDTKHLEQWCHAQVKKNALIFIEGAGGIMTPITEHYSMLDLMAALRLPVILVVGSYLGAISHTRMALEVLRARGMTIEALVISESEASTVPLDEAMLGLAPFIQDVKLQIVQPRISSWKEAQAIHALMEKL